MLKSIEGDSVTIKAYYLYSSKSRIESLIGHTIVKYRYAIEYAIKLSNNDYEAKGYTIADNKSKAKHGAMNEAINVLLRSGQLAKDTTRLQVISSLLDDGMGYYFYKLMPIIEAQLGLLCDKRGLKHG